MVASRLVGLGLLLAAAAEKSHAQTWTQLAPAAAPSARNRHEMVTLPNGRVFLFGGRTGGGASLGDSWLWDGVSWGQLAVAPSPSPRAGRRPRLPDPPPDLDRGPDRPAGVHGVERAGRRHAVTLTGTS